jgi:hypothetical protein
MKKKLLTLGVLGISLGVPLKLFVDKADEEAQSAYQQAQIPLAKINIDKLRMLQSVQCIGMDLGTYFLLKADEKGLPPEVSAIIPQESSGDVYATGCDPCPDSWKETMRRKRDPINSQWLDMVFGQGLHNYCLRRNANRENTCTVGFGLMQITSHTISEGKYTGLVQPSALTNTKAHMVKGRGDYSAANEEPNNSPYNPCKNIEVGLLILRDKYEICKRKYGDKSAKTMACAVCYYNGRTDYLAHLRRTVIDRGQAGLLVRAGFVKDGMLEGLRKFLVDIEGFVKGWNEEEKRGTLCINVFQP